MKLSKKDILTIPNFLSFFRLILIPIFLYLYLSVRNFQLAAVVLIISGLTDFADGFIARTFNQISEFGKALDPIADKLTQAAIVICLLLRHKRVWIIFLIFIIKELYMGINDLLLLKKGKKLSGAKWFGKLSTAIFYICMTSLIMFPLMNKNIVNLLLIITGVFLTLSFLLYIPVFTKMHRDIK